MLELGRLCSWNRGESGLPPTADEEKRADNGVTVSEVVFVTIVSVFGSAKGSTGLVEVVFEGVVSVIIEIGVTGFGEIGLLPGKVTNPACCRDPITSTLLNPCGLAGVII